MFRVGTDSFIALCKLVSSLSLYFQTLSNFIKDELNVKETVTTTDKAKYGVKLVAQPDHKTLGLKLKGAFKVGSHMVEGLLYLKILNKCTVKPRSNGFQETNFLKICCGQYKNKNMISTDLCCSWVR